MLVICKNSARLIRGGKVKYLFIDTLDIHFFQNTLWASH